MYESQSPSVAKRLLVLPSIDKRRIWNVGKQRLYRYSHVLCVNLSISLCLQSSSQAPSVNSSILHTENVSKYQKKVQLITYVSNTVTCHANTEHVFSKLTFKIYFKVSLRTAGCILTTRNSSQLIILICKSLTGKYEIVADKSEVSRSIRCVT